MISSGSKSLFLPPAYLGLAPADRGILLPSPEESRGACANPRSFFSLNRTHRFDTVFLASGSYCAPLRDQILASPLWVLSAVLPEGYLFRQAGSPAWRTPDEAEAIRLHPDPEKRSAWLCGIAGNLVAIGRNDEAEALLRMSSGSKEGEALRLSTMASLEASRGNWIRAAELCRMSLKLDGSSRGARIIMIRSLAESGKTDEALGEALALVRSSEDAETLFLLARAANAAGDRTGEIDALRRLVSAGRKNGQPVGASLLYLGQALGREGQRGEALRALDDAMQAPELTEEQKALVRQLHDHLTPEKTDQG
jgi:tetratricopeptide (TPR) repeat protein